MDWSSNYNFLVHIFFSNYARRGLSLTTLFFFPLYSLFDPIVLNNLLWCALFAALFYYDFAVGNMIHYMKVNA